MGKSQLSTKKNERGDADVESAGERLLLSSAMLGTVIDFSLNLVRQSDRQTDRLVARPLARGRRCVGSLSSSTWH